MIQIPEISKNQAGKGMHEHSAWLHLCNGLDPVRDGGMVPSILGMTGALSRLGGNVSIVTPTPSQLDNRAIEERLILEGPETDIERAVRSVDLVHIHGLWQAPNATRGQDCSGSSSSLPDHGSRDGRALGLAT